MQLDIPCIKQFHENDCWICCSVMIYNFFFKNQTINYTGTMPALIKKYLDEKKFSYGKPRSTSDFLAWTGKFDVPADGCRLPPFEKAKENIMDEISKGHPLLCLVKDDPRKGVDDPDLNCKDGHWIIISGYEQTPTGDNLLIIDPDPNVVSLISIPYDNKTYFYRDEMYFQSTTYPDLKTPKS